MEDVDKITTADALGDWRSAERAVTVGRRGKVAAAAAVEAASEAMDAAQATANAAKAAVAASTLAEESAARTVSAAKIVVESRGDDLSDAASDLDMADAVEAGAHERYREASAKASERSAIRKS